jgi:VWFA-related protein
MFRIAAIAASAMLLLHPLMQAQGVRGAPPPAATRTNPLTPEPKGIGGVNSNVAHPRADDEGRIEFRSDTILIEVPVVVTDKSGKHLHGLKQEDFEVLENGKPQKITAFEELTATENRVAAVPPKDGVYTNLAPENGKVPTVAVIALDTVNTPYLDQTYGRKQLIKYLSENLDSGQAMGLVAITSRGVKILHSFTSDPAVLSANLKKLTGELPMLTGVDLDAQAISAMDPVLQDPNSLAPTIFDGPATDTASESYLKDFVINGDVDSARLQQQRAIEVTMRGFTEIAWALSGIPGRKSLIWATSGFPFFMDSPNSVPGGYLSTLYERAMQALNDAQVSVYPVDVRGLVNTMPAADASLPSQSSKTLFRTVQNRSWFQSSTIDTLRDFADMTGGRAFYNTNDLAGSFRRAMDDSSSYYMLGYYLDTKNNKAGWRNLKVKVRQPGSTVRARSGFFVTNATMNPAGSRKEDIQFALSSPLESTGVPVMMKWQSVSGNGPKKDVRFVLNVPVSGFSVNDASRTPVDMEFVSVAMTKNDGRVADGTSQSLQVSNPQTLAKLKTDGMFYASHIQLPPGSYEVRFVVRDNQSGKIGSVSAPITVN